MQFSEYSDNVENTAVYYTKIAVIEKCTKDFLIRFSSLCYLRGRYEIDYSVIETLKKRCIFNKMELRELNVLLRDMEFINARKSVIYRILHSILDKQKDYFISGDPLSLVPYTQKEIAQQLKIDNSIVSRAIYSKSIVTPFAQEKPLDFFLPSTKDVYKLKVQMIIKDNPGVSDTKIGAILNTKYNISISRRSISVYRKNLGIKTYYKRSYK